MRRGILREHAHRTAWPGLPVPGEDSGASRILDPPRNAGTAIRWRWRRFVVRRRRILVPGVLAACIAGFFPSPHLHDWSRGTILFGNEPVSGQVLVRPPVGSGAMQGAGVRLVPAGVWSLGAALHLAARGEQAEVLHAGTDFAGRWSADARLIAGWRYAVIVEAEECPPRLAGTVDVGWFATSRVDTVLRSCRGRWNTPKEPLRRR